MKVLLQSFLILSSVCAAIITFINLAYAQTSSNPDYVIEHQELEQKTYHPENAKQNNPRLIVGENYQAVLGFGDIPQISFFSIKISGTILDYGKLYPTNPILRETIIETGGQSAHGYSVLGYEDHPLADESFSNLIPDTSCDRGLCSQATSAIWKDHLTYGFGYTCESLDKSLCVGFEDTNSYKSFPDASKSEAYQPVFKAINSENSKAKIIHKLNVSASQKNKIYLNNINYLAVPNL
ncbi:MAG: hypothetical protein AAB531_02505 [Patescibacteria group bacterium]